MNTEQMTFSETEKQALTLRLQQAARAVRPIRAHRLPRRAVILCAAAALTLAAAGAAATYLAQGRYLTIEGQDINADALMTLHEDGSATVLVTGANGQITEITVPAETAPGLLDGTNPMFAGQYEGEAPYLLETENGRLVLRVKGRVPLDVTDLIAAGYVFTYTDENGAQQAATITGTVDDYTVQ